MTFVDGRLRGQGRVPFRIRHVEEAQLEALRTTKLWGNDVHVGGGATGDVSSTKGNSGRVEQVVEPVRRDRERCGPARGVAVLPGEADGERAGADVVVVQLLDE